MQKLNLEPSPVAKLISDETDICPCTNDRYQADILTPRFTAPGRLLTELLLRTCRSARPTGDHRHPASHDPNRTTTDDRFRATETWDVCESNRPPDRTQPEWFSMEFVAGPIIIHWISDD